MKSLDIYGTLGPSLHTQDALYEMLCMGMNGVRLNLSHVDLTAAHRYEGTGAAGRKAEGACLIGRTADSRTGEGHSDSCGAAGSYGGTTEASAG